MKIFQTNGNVFASSSLFALKILAIFFFTNPSLFASETKGSDQIQSSVVCDEPLNIILINSCASQNLGATEFHALQALSAHCAPIVVRKSVLSKIKDSLITEALLSCGIIPQFNRILTIFENWHIFNTNMGDFCILIPAPDWAVSAQVVAYAQHIGLLADEKEYAGNLNALIFNNCFPFNDMHSVQDVAEIAMNREVDHKWNIFLMGHGLSNMIAGFSIREFRNFLIYLNDAQRVNALVYTTCYGAGNNLIESYTYNKSPLHLNYVVACQCLRFSISVVDCYEDFRQLFYELDNRAAYHSWDECFQAAFNGNMQNLGSNAYVAYCNEQSLISNFPWIRNPEADKFHLLSLPLYHAQPYTFAEDQLEGAIILTPQIHALIVQHPCINRPIIAHYFPSIVSIGDNKFHYFKSLTHSGVYLDETMFRTFDGLRGAEEQFTYLFGEYKCCREGHLYTYTNVRIENKPIGIWQKFMQIIQHGTKAKIPKFTKIITAECEEGQVIRKIINQELFCNYKTQKIIIVVCCSLLSIFLATWCKSIPAPKEQSFWKSLFEEETTQLISPEAAQFFSNLLGILAAAIPMWSWFNSFHINLECGNLGWSQSHLWKTLSADEALNYRNEFNRQHQELIDLAARQQAELDHIAT